MTAHPTDYEKRILENVREYGCHVTTVFDPESDDPDFAYSTGFAESVDQGEVIVFGLPRDLMHRMVNLVHKECADGLRLGEGTFIDGLLEGFRVAVRAIPPERIDRDHFNSAMWFHHRTFGGALTRAFQLVWPGAKDGLFPWDEGCDPSVRGWQPALYDIGVAN